MNANENQKMKISFNSEEHAPVEIPKGANLSEHLTIQNSPILFGCRTGICGTCLVSVSELSFELEPPSEDEKEVLETLVPGEDQIRLACQMKVTGNCTLKMEEEL